MFNTNIVKKWNYGKYSNSNYGSHSLAFTDNFNNDYYFQKKILEDTQKMEKFLN